MVTSTSLSFKLVSSSGTGASLKIINYSTLGYVLEYPCSSTTTCTAYESTFPPGRYLIKAFGASGGGEYVSYRNKQSKNKCIEQETSFIQGNVQCITNYNTAGAGAIVAGVLILNQPTKLYFNLGGKGKSGNWGEVCAGGYNGGGEGIASSGGGATDVRAEKNTAFNRILVAGGGGGSDDADNLNDGIGGSAGGLTAQSFWVSGVYKSGYEASQTSGFSFFQGEGSAKSQTKSYNSKGYQAGSSDSNERPGAGGGWYGGFSSHDHNGGGGGGSSFALTLSSSVTSSTLRVYNRLYNTVSSGTYAYSKNRPIYFEDVEMLPGAWDGNGRVEIFMLSASKVIPEKERSATSLIISLFSLTCMN